MFSIQTWLLWAILALVCIIVEIFTVGFAIMCFSFGAVAAAICAACGLGVAWQIVAFSVFTALAFLVVRPFVLKHFYSKNDVKTNADALIGRTARISEEINHTKNTGRVAVDGDDWKAVALNDAVLPVGEQVEIVSRNSIILTVKPIKPVDAENV